MGYCGNCAKYVEKPLCEDICAKTGKIVPYFAQKPCFIDKKTNPDAVEYAGPKRDPNETSTRRLMKDPDRKKRTHAAPSVLKRRNGHEQ